MNDNAEKLGCLIALLSAITIWVVGAYVKDYAKAKLPHRCELDGHYFKSRYDYADSTDDIDLNDGDDAAEVLEISRRKNYVCDVCLYCGKQTIR